MNPARRIREEIAASIQSGEWRPGDRVPTEQELAARYGCARATVSKALGELAASGLVERRRKAGTFVARPPVHSAVMTVPDLAELIAARGQVYRWELASLETASAGDDPLSGPALRIEGVHIAAGEAFALERRFIALGEVPEAANADFAKNRLFHVLFRTMRMSCMRAASHRRRSGARHSPVAPRLRAGKRPGKSRQRC